MPFPDDVTPAMLDQKTGGCIVCERETDYICEDCGEPLCDLDHCEAKHREETGHDAGYWPGED